MKVRMDELIKSIAVALEMVESDLLGASTNHGKRIAVLCSQMAKELNMDENERLAVITSALFHDNALTEYALYKKDTGDDTDLNFKLHCVYGQRNIDKIPLGFDTKDLILYHHEEADGNGPFGIIEEFFPIGAALIAIADMVDVDYHLQHIPVKDIQLIRDHIILQRGKRYTKKAADAMLSVFTKDLLLSLNDENINNTAKDLFPVWHVDLEDESLISLAGLVADIIDNKSPFTRKHSVGIAEKTLAMCEHYGFDHVVRSKAYLAAAFHDIGKLAVPDEILNKPGKLTDEEFTIIKSHVSITNEILSGVTGFEEICRWASSHHEKLDGTGYHLGINSGKIDFISRLLACADIYQAISEERPYHPARSHEETMPILYDMAGKGFIDSFIVEDFDKVMADINPCKTIITGCVNGNAA